MSALSQNNPSHSGSFQQGSFQQGSFQQGSFQQGGNSTTGGQPNWGHESNILTTPVFPERFEKLPRAARLEQKRFANNLLSLIAEGKPSWAVADALKRLSQGYTLPSVFVALAWGYRALGRLDAAQSVIDNLKARNCNPREIRALIESVEELAAPRQAELRGGPSNPNNDRINQLIAAGELKAAVYALDRFPAPLLNPTLRQLRNQLGIAVDGKTARCESDVDIAYFEAKRLLNENTAEASAFLSRLDYSCLNSARICSLSARILLMQQKRSLARDRLEKAIVAGPFEIADNLAELSQLNLPRRMRTSQSVARWAIDIDPQQPKAHSTLARWAMQEGSIFDAKLHIDAALRGPNPAAMDFLNAGIIYSVSGDWASGLRYFDQFAEMGVDSVELTLFRELFALSQRAPTAQPDPKVLENLATFIDDFQAIGIELWESLHDVRYASIPVLRAVSRAYGLFGEWLRSHEYSALQLRLADVKTIGPSQGTFDFLNNILEVDSDVAAYVIMRLSEKHPNLAVEYGLEATRHIKTGWQHHYDLGRLYEQLGNDPLAEKNFRRAILRESEPLIMPRVRLARILIDRVELEEAFDFLNAALDIEPTNAAALHQFARIELLDTALQKNRPTCYEIVNSDKKANDALHGLAAINDAIRNSNK